MFVYRSQVAWGTAVMELQSWLLYHLVAVTDCNQGSEEDSSFVSRSLEPMTFVFTTRVYTQTMCVALNNLCLILFDLILVTFAWVCAADHSPVSHAHTHSHKFASSFSPLVVLFDFFHFSCVITKSEETVVYRCLTVSLSQLNCVIHTHRNTMHAHRSLYKPRSR